MSNCERSSSTPTPELEDRSIGTPPCRPPSPSSSGPATRRTRSASNRSLPAETGRVDREHAVARGPSSSASSSGGPSATSSRARSASRNAEWPSLRCQTAGVDAERPQRPDAADAEHELLVEPHLAAADVEDVGDRAVGVVVLGHVGVEQQHRHAADLGDPDRDGERRGRAARTVHRAAARRRVRRPAASGRRVEVVVGVGVLLVAVGVDRLAEVALAVEEPDADERQGHVADADFMWSPARTPRPPE